MKRVKPIFHLIFLLLIYFSVQYCFGQNSLLHEFSRNKNVGWKLEKRKADSLASILGLPIYYIEQNSNAVIILQRLGRNNKPVYYSTNNLNAAETISVDQVWSNSNEYPSLSGEGIEINLWDGGSIRATHQEYLENISSRITPRDLDLPLSSHSTHIAGTMIASGVNEAAKGIAGSSTIATWDLNDDIAEMSGAAAEGIVVSNHSYGPLCGWDYNSNNESWYWYGDLEISTTEDYEFGFYNQVSADLDYIAQLAPRYLIVKSAGNDRQESPSSYEHYVWEGSWKLVTTEREPDGGMDGYDCLTPMAVGKNILVVGAVDNSRNITSFSAFGPTDDGRIKPDVVTNGDDIFSCNSSGDDEYITYSGTSMSAASATGSIALLHQLQHTILPGVEMLSSTVKGLLIHTATDLGNTGPDFQFGWGLLNIKDAADLIYRNSHNQGENIYEKVLTNEDEIIIPVSTNSTSYLKVTICWTDPSGQVSTPFLNSRERKLINDLDILVENSSSFEIHKPWVLDVENPGLSATQDINHVDNVEQIYINNPGENNFNIKISHSGILSGGSQRFSLIISGNEATSNIFPPKNLSYTIDESKINLEWYPPDLGIPELYKVYKNGTLLTSTEEKTFSDESIVHENIYEYYVTAEYEINDQKFESLGSNEITVIPQSLRPLPFIVDFEKESDDILYKNKSNGWRWGDSELLNCYYLDFSDNTTKFIGADSYSAGEAIHVSDVAVTPPLRLAEYDSVILSFDYLLKTGIYHAIDEMYVVYKIQEEKEWQEFEQLEEAFEWTHHSIELPSELCKNGIQLGFYYDDNYQWGMGAGLDNIQLTGNLIVRDDISIESINEPGVQLCFQDNALDLTLTIKNSGATIINTGEIISINTSCNGVEKTVYHIFNENLEPGFTKRITFSGLIDPIPIGEHSITANLSWAKDQYPDNNSEVKNIIVNNLPQITFIESVNLLCENSDPVEISVTPTGGVLQNEYMIGSTFDPILAGIGLHEIYYNYTDANGCTNTSSISIDVVPIPSVSFTGLSVEYCLNNPSVNLFGIPAGGIFSGPGIHENTFSPEAAGIGTHMIIYSFSDVNSCTNTIQQQTNVNPLTPLSFTNLANSYCQNDDPIILTAVPDGGTFYINDIVRNELDPSQYLPGTIEIRYLFENANGCNSSISKNVNIMALPEVLIADPGNPQCFTDVDIDLVGQPSGGTFSGEAVRESIFNPQQAGIGVHDIFYTYEDVYQCTNMDTLSIQVVALPAVSFTGLAEEYCINEDQAILTGSPVNGVFSGAGIDGNIFDPALTNAGIQEILYEVTDENGCTNSITQSTTVVELTDVVFLNLSDRYCQNNAPVILSAQPEGGTFYINNEEKYILTSEEFGTGIVDISYVYKDDNECITEENKQVELLAIPELAIEDLFEMYCQTNEDYELKGRPNGGEFVLDGETITHINPMELGDGSYDLLYKYTDAEGCSSTISRSFIVTSNPKTSIEGLEASYCPNEESVILSGVPPGGYFEGSGIQENVFSPQSLTPGNYQIKYTYNSNGCDLSTTASTTISDFKDVNITGLLPEYCPNDSLTEVYGIPDGGSFSINPMFEEIVDGTKYQLFYTYADLNNCKFIDSAFFMIFTKPELSLPSDLELTNEDTVYLELPDPSLKYFWTTDSSSSIFNLKGKDYDNGENVLNLAILDNYGCVTYFEFVFKVISLTAINDPNSSSKVTIFPNPAHDLLNIEFKNDSISILHEITIFNLNGKWTNHWQIQNNYKGNLQLDISNLSSGLYMISISCADQQIRKIFNVVK